MFSASTLKSSDEEHSAQCQIAIVTIATWVMTSFGQLP